MAKQAIGEDSLTGRTLGQFLLRGVIDVIFFSRGFGHVRLIHFLFDAGQYCLVGLLLWLFLVHNVQDVTSPKGLQVNSEQSRVSELFWQRASRRAAMP